MGSSPNHSQIPDGKKTNQTPYSAWLQTEVQELYWALIVKEMQAAQACLREDNLAEAHEAFTTA